MDDDTPEMFVMVPAKELTAIKTVQQEILTTLQEIKTRISTSPGGSGSEYISSEQFMKATLMKKSKFYDMVNNNKIRVLRKMRKTYVLASEVKRFFTDPTMS